MSTSANVVSGLSEAEITEKKSRFIAVCTGVSSQEEARAFIDGQRKKYYDARHTCFAYVIGDNNEISRFSDDGEPHGTAGKPILDVITGNSLKNALICVTRYFGGTLLGTGGLVRAYSGAASAAVDAGIESGTIKSTEKGRIMTFTIGYKDVGRFEALKSKIDFQIKEKEFSENVTFTLAVRENDTESLKNNVINMTNGAAEISEGPVMDIIF